MAGAQVYEGTDAQKNINAEAPPRHASMSEGGRSIHGVDDGDDDDADEIGTQSGSDWVGGTPRGESLSGQLAKHLFVFLSRVWWSVASGKQVSDLATGIRKMQRRFPTV
ncbi:hypothetical protein MUK42_34397 [Musa troglodytarum]|uniref:Uncharacterized protein n=1 Tax=Musa troglodytarum TaxID=320322 RepID=A0A9E7EA87_9LILI|nr:hypothetical protein MUK42_34397 [Musa troglodytarum]